MKFWVHYSLLKLLFCSKRLIVQLALTFSAEPPSVLLSPTHPASRGHHQSLSLCSRQGHGVGPLAAALPDWNGPEAKSEKGRG